MKILSYPLEEVPEEFAQAANTLQRATWPEAIWEPENGEIPAYLEKRAGTIAFLVIDNQLLGYAEIFPRTIYAANRAIDIWGLASVCVSKESQGSGIGRQLVSACFQYVDDQKGVSLFQTTVPGFYEKLGCKTVPNDFINKTDPVSADKNPFWDEYTMIHPTTFNWPSGPIDLNGRGY